MLEFPSPALLVLARPTPAAAVREDDNIVTAERVPPPAVAAPAAMPPSLLLELVAPHTPIPRIGLARGRTGVAPAILVRSHAVDRPRVFTQLQEWPLPAYQTVGAEPLPAPLPVVPISPAHAIITGRSSPPELVRRERSETVWTALHWPARSSSTSANRSSARGSYRSLYASLGSPSA